MYNDRITKYNLFIILNYTMICKCVHKRFDIVN